MDTSMERNDAKKSWLLTWTTDNPNTSHFHGRCFLKFEKE
jgi:hypothetical protein